MFLPEVRGQVHDRTISPKRARAHALAAGRFHVLNVSLIWRPGLHLKRVSVSENQSKGGGDVLMMSPREEKMEE